MTTIDKYDNIILRVNLKFADFTVTLRKWIDDEMYKDTHYFVLSVTNSDGDELPLTTIPPEYRNRNDSYYRDIALWYQPIKFVKSLLKKLSNK